MGHLGPQWKDWFDEMTMTLEENGETVLTGSVADQPALHGLLKKVRDLGMNLVAVNRIDLNQGGASGVKDEEDKSVEEFIHQRSNKMSSNTMTLEKKQDDKRRRRNIPVQRWKDRWIAVLDHYRQRHFC